MDTNEIRAFIQEHWGDAVLTAIDAEPALQMSFDEFLDHQEEFLAITWQALVNQTTTITSSM